MTTATAPQAAWPRISPAAARGFAYVLAAIGIVALLTGYAIYTAVDDIPWLWPMVISLAVGTLILHRLPTHPVGWVFLWLGALSGITVAGTGFVLGSVLELGGIPLPADRAPGWLLWASLLAEALNTATVVLLVPLSLLLFPDGRLPSRRWRVVPWIGVATALIGATAAVLNGGWGGDTAQSVIISPFVDTAAASVSTTAMYPMMMGVWIASAVSVILRFRRATGIERVQLKWLAAAAMYSILAVIGTLVVAGGRADGVYAYPLALAMGGPPLAAGIAILRHRLFDIDVVIRRSLLVAGLLVFVTVLYVAIVVGLGQALGAGLEGNAWVGVAATAVVALAFQPVRDRLEALANRVVYGQRATPYEVLTTIAHEVAGTADPDALLQRAAAALAAGTGALEVTVWMRVGDRLRPAAHVAADGTERAGVGEVAVDGDQLPPLGADVAVEVCQNAQLLGAVTLRKPRGEPATETDTAVARRLADQIGVALTNLRLTAELRQRADELAASRRRILTAVDDERRLLERRLSERAGQTLVALGTSLQLEQRAEGTPPRVREQLVAVAEGVREAVDELHRLTRGLYPPLLQSEGLARALRAAADRSAMTVHVDTDGVGRLPLPHETAIYFSVLEALANAAKHADSPSARVTVRRSADAVTFTVVDAGRGFDPSHPNAGTGLANMRDRLAALDGTLVVASSPGAGTTVSGSVPLAPEAAAGDRDGAVRDAAAPLGVAQGQGPS